MSATLSTELKDVEWLDNPFHFSSMNVIPAKVKQLGFRHKCMDANARKDISGPNGPNESRQQIPSMTSAGIFVLFRSFSSRSLEK